MFVYMTLTSFRRQICGPYVVGFKGVIGLVRRCSTGCPVSEQIVCTRPKLRFRYNVVGVSDPTSKRWLADDPGFQDSVGNLDRGLAVGDEPIERAARAMDASRALDTTPSPARVAAPRPAPPSSVESEILSEEDLDALPPFLFTQPTAGDPRGGRPPLDLFPPASLEREAAGPLDALTYESFYGLQERPFSLSTDPRFHYQSASHERAGQDILGAVRARAGAAVLTAPLGMGKTTLCRSLIADLDPRTATSLVVDPIHSINDLLKTMLVDFGVMAREDLAAVANVSREVLLGTLSSFLESLAGLDAGAVAFLDEAQNLPISLLGDLAVVIGAPAARVLQLVLVGQPALTAAMNHGDLRALSAAVSRRITLGPLEADEISSYVAHRLAIAGANTRVEFDEGAIAELFALSAGSPRMVNLLCERALTRGHAASAAVIDLRLI